MKRITFIPILAILVLASGLTLSCGENQSTVELRAYFTKELPIAERHSETLAAVSKAAEVIDLEANKPVTQEDKPSSSPKTQMEAIELPKPSEPTGIGRLSVEEMVKFLSTPRPAPPQPIIPSGLKEALTSGVDTLDWALERIDSEILDYKKLSPPPEAATYHGLMVETLLKEQAYLNDMNSYFRSILRSGRGDNEALDRAKKQSAERDKLRSLAEYEFQDLLEKLRK